MLSYAPTPGILHSYTLNHSHSALLRRFGLHRFHRLGLLPQLVRVNDRSLELPRWSLLLEQKVQFSVSAVLGFRQTEEGPDEADGAVGRPEESGFGAPVPAIGVEHV